MNGTEHKWKYQGKEHEEELGLNWHDFGARNHDASIGRWTSIDPLAEDFYSFSTYNSMMNDPINFVDPDGRSADWIPQLNEDGLTSYLAEDGDNAQTLQSQYGLSEEDANAIYSTMENGEISGQDVFNVTGSEKMKLDLTSKQATGQRVIDQFVYAIGHSKSKGARSWAAKAYFGGVFTQLQGPTPYSGSKCVDGESCKVQLELEWFTSLGGMFTGKRPTLHQAVFSNNLNTIKDRRGQALSRGKNGFGTVEDITQLEIQYGFLFPKSKGGLRWQGNMKLTTHKRNSYAIEKTVFVKRPKYNYIKTSNFKN